MPPRRRSAEQDEERHRRSLRQTRCRVPIQSRARPLVGRQLWQPRVQVRPRRPEVQALASLLPPEILNLIELRLERTLHQEAQSRRLAHRIQENNRRRALRQSRRACAEAGFNRPIIIQGHGVLCQCQPGQFQPNCRVQDICPTTGRPVRLHFARGADHSTARMIYFATGDEVYPGMYAISGDEWEHDSGNESDSSLPLFSLE